MTGGPQSKVAARLSARIAAHNSWYFNRPIWVLARLIASAIPTRGTVLQFGAPDARLASALAALRPDLRVDALPLEAELAPPSDYALLVDVLDRHADPAAILMRAASGAQHAIIVKDRLRPGLDEAAWHAHFFRARLQSDTFHTPLDLHLPPAGWLLNRRHFLASVTRRA